MHSDMLKNMQRTCVRGTQMHRTQHRITYNDLLRVLAKIDLALLLRGVHTEDGADRDTGVDVGRAVNGVEHDNVVAYTGTGGVNTCEMLQVRLRRDG